MAITSELIGGLNTPGYGFHNGSPKTYKLPKYHAGISIMVARWSGSGELSYDILDRETGSVVDGSESPSYANQKSFTSPEVIESLKKGALIRFNNSTAMQVYIIPNPRQAPPEWNS